MSASLLLDQIPNDYRTPGTYIRVRPNYTNAGLVGFPAHGLIIAQKTVSGFAGVNVPYAIYSAAQAVLFAGSGSIAARMAQRWFDNNPYTPLDMVFVGDATNASAASLIIYIPGFTATTPLYYPFRIAGVDVPITLQVGQGWTDLQAMLIAAVNSNTDLPVTAAASLTGSNVVLTAKNAGLNGNAIDVALVADGSGVFPLLSGSPAVIGLGQVGNTAFTLRSTLQGGLGNPDVSSVFPAIASSWYTDIVIPWTDAANIAEFTAELNRRYTATVRKDAHGYVALGATLTTAIANPLGAVNCPYLSPLPMQGIKTPPEEVAAAMAANCCYRSSQDPALQMKSMVLVGVTAPDPADVFTEDEQNLLLHNGMSTYEVERDGTVTLQRVVTTYETTANGAPDTAWLDIMAAKVATRIRWDWLNYVKLQYPANKLTVDGSRASEYDPTIATPNRLLGSWVGRTALYANAGWIENEDAENKKASFTIDPNDINRCNSVQPYQRIGNLMLLDVDLQFEA